MQLHYQSALLSDGWSNDVVIKINDVGEITAIETNVAGASPGCLIPGIANLHSHAQQRAMAGLAEHASSGDDSFWTWRDLMYRFVAALQPHHLRAIAAQLYLEMLQQGYTRVAEFHYLHHRPDGKLYDNPAEMSLQVLQAARDTGIGLTHLPVLYQYSNFGEQPPSLNQSRFINSPESLLDIVAEFERTASQDANVNIGIAGHSLRATTQASLQALIDGLGNTHAPIHLHIAEQQKEVRDCLAWCGTTPVDYCLNNFDVDRRWCLVHATHMTNRETQKLAASGAVAGLCPTTEANLGDGFFNATTYLNAGGCIGIGSDSQVSTSPVEELRWLEYGQRLQLQARNVLASEGQPSTGRRLFDAAVAGGSQACGIQEGSIAIGKPADLLVLDSEHSLLIGRQRDALLDSWIFSGNSNPVKHVFVGGQAVIQDGQHPYQNTINRRFHAAIQELCEL